MQFQNSVPWRHCFTAISRIKFILLIIHVCFFSITGLDTKAQMRKVYHDAIDADNEVKKISFYSGSQGYVAFTKWIGFTADSGKTFIKKPITIGNVDFNNYNVNLTFGFGISGVKAFNRDTLVAYGDYGLVPAVLYSTNGGNSFKLVYHSQYNPFQLSSGIMDMIFPENNNIGYAVDADRILKTIDKGVNWFTVSVDPGSFFESLEGIDNSHVFAYSTGYNSSKLVKTSNAGINWQLMAHPPGQILSASFISVNKGWLSLKNDSEGNLFYTSNGGLSWTQKNDADATPFFGHRMKFIDDSTGYSIGSLFTIFETSDSGKIWQPLPRDNDFTHFYFSHNDIQIWNKNQLWAGGGHGLLELNTNIPGYTLPKAFFKIDTATLSVTNTVNLRNYSKPGYQYKWFKNNTLISTAYQASYIHELDKAGDTIKLVVINGANSDTLIKYQYFEVTPPPPTPVPYTGWVEKATNIDDNLTDVRFFGNYGIVLGDKGIYYTTTGASDGTGWKKFEIKNSQPDSLQLTHIKFKQLAFDEESPVFYICGNDIVNNKAVLFKVDLSSLEYAFLYRGALGTQFNSLIVTGSYPLRYLHVVGNDGMYVSYSLKDNTANIAYFPDRRNLTSIFRRLNNEFNTSIGVISDSILYVGGGNHTFSLAYANNLGRRITGAASFSGVLDGHIDKSKGMLYLISSASGGYLVIDSITKIKTAGLQYNIITNAKYGNYKFIGTNRGIYQVIFSNSANLSSGVIEYQPTSNQKPINGIWFRNNAQYDTGYAVGPNGVLLQTLNFGGPSIPHAQINGSGNCVGDITLLSGSRGSGTNCKWYVDNVFRADNCNYTEIVFNAVGYHTIKYIVSNIYGMADTAITSIYISPAPVINLPVTVSDTILCKSETLIAGIKNTETGFKYELIQESSGKSMGAVNGVGGQAFLGSQPINESGNYFIRVSGVNSGCTRNFTDKIYIKVEHTKSNFIGNKMNVIPGEKINYFQRSQEAKSFAWTFHGDASIPNSLLANPSNISYSSPGAKAVTLISTSEYGCADTIMSENIFVFNKPAPDEMCYVQNINDSDFSYFPDSPPSINKVVHNPADNGYFISGFGNNPLLKSRYGMSKQCAVSGMAYFAKYTTDGVLSWMNYFKGEGHITDGAVDNSGNIYLLGDCSVQAYFYFNNGDSIKISATSNELGNAAYNGFILKMDPNGRYLWHTIIDDPSEEFQGYPVRGGYENKIKIKNDHIIVTGRFLANLAYYRNGNKKTLITLPNSTYENDLGNIFIFKIKADGSLLWDTYFEFNATNLLYNLSGVGLDENGNSYLAGYYENSLRIHDAGSADIMYGGGNGQSNGYLVKLDPMGKLVWSNKYPGTAFYAMANGKNGDCYVTGMGGGSFQLTSIDGSTHNLSLAAYILLKFDSAGMYRWGVGSKFPYYGQGNSVYLNGNDLYTTFNISNNGVQTSTFTLTSTDSSDINMEFHESEFAIANYDTSGVLKRIVKSGSNAGGHVVPNQLVIDNAQNFLVSGMTDDWNGGASQFNFFGKQLSTNGMDGFFAKLDPNYCYSSVSPVANAGIDKSVCIGDSVSIGMTATGDNYSWISSPAGFNSILANPVVKPVVTTTYYLTVSNDAGMIARDTVTINVAPLPVADAGIDKDICLGAETTIGKAATNDNMYNWTSSPSGFVSAFANPKVSPVSNTTYYLSVLSPAGCLAMDTAVITVNTFLTPAVSVNASATSICSGNEVIFMATAVNGGDTPDYQWKLNGNNIGSNTSSFASSALTNGAEVQVILTSSNSCVNPTSAASNIITMIVNPSSNPSIIISGTTTIIKGDSTLLTATTMDGGISPVYEWQDSTTTHNWQDINGAVSQTLRYTPLHTGDKIRCALTNNDTCANPSVVYSAALEFVLNTVTALDPSPASSYGIRFYPNPASTVLHIDSLKISDKWQTLEISNTGGQQVSMTDKITNQTRLTIDVGHYPAGLYIAILRRKSGEAVYIKFIKL